MKESKGKKKQSQPPKANASQPSQKGLTGLVQKVNKPSK
jgi:hypothetical protein